MQGVSTKLPSSAQAPLQAVDSPIVTGGASGPGGVLNGDKDAKEASTDAKFGEVWKQIQSKYGAKTEKPKEIKKTLGKDDFLRIMITQMKNQDPSSPFKAEQFATELAQYTSVEQLSNIAAAMNKLTTANQPLERLGMTGLIGKTITVDRERFPHTEGSNESLTYTLPRDAKTVHVTILSEAGEVITEKDVGSQKAGDSSFSWDGLKSNTIPTKNGTYLFRVSAKDENDTPIPLNPKGKAKVVGVSFEGSDPILLVGDAARPDKVLFKNVVQIDQNQEVISAAEQGSLIPGARSLGGVVNPKPAVTAPRVFSPQAMLRAVDEDQAREKSESVEPAIQSITAQPKSPNFFSYQKGLGSQTINPSQAQGDAAEAIRRYQAQAAAAASASQSKEKGFPSGLSDSNQSITEKGGEP